MDVRAEVAIRASAQMVFDVIATPERLPAWNEAVVWAKRATDAPVQAGSRAFMRGRVLGQLVDSETEVTEFQPPRWFATRGIRGPRLETRFSLEPFQDGVWVRVEARGDVPGGKLGNAIAARVLGAELRRALQRLRALCERDARDQEPPST